MRYLIISDTHGRHTNYEDVIRTIGHLDGVIHCGDSEGGLIDMEAWLDCPMIAVGGNCDFGEMLPLDHFMFLGNHKIMITHGQKYHVKMGLEYLVEEAKRNGCDTVLFGHTHNPIIDERAGITLVNPGSLSYPHRDNPSYAIMTMDDTTKKLTFKLYYLE